MHQSEWQVKSLENMRDLVHCLVFVATFFTLCHTITAQTFPHINSSRYFKSGDVTIGGLFPVHVRTVTHVCADEDLKTNHVVLTEAMVFAIKEINHNPKILPNIKLGFDIRDTCLINKLAMRSALEFVNYNDYASSNANFQNRNAPSCSGVIRTDKIAPVSAVIGTMTSRSSTLVSNILQVQDIPLVSYSATSDQLSSTLNFPNFLRTVPPDRFQSKAMVDIARYFNWTYVAAIAEDDAYGRKGIEYFRNHAKSSGICLAVERYFPVKGSTTVRIEMIKDIIKELKSHPKVGVAVLYSDGEGAMDVVTEAEKQGVTGITWIASEAWATNRFVSWLPKNFPRRLVKGVIGVSLRKVLVEKFKRYVLSLNSTYQPTGWWKKFWKHKMWEDKLNCTVGSTPGMKKCPLPLKITESIYEHLHDEKDAPVIDATYAIAKAIDNIFKCKEPNGSISGGNCPRTKPFLDPKDVLLYLKNVNVSGPTSPISFDKNGDYPGFYSLVNFQQTKSGKGWAFKEIGTWNEKRIKRLVLNEKAIAWNDEISSPVPKSVCSETCSPGYRQTKTIGCCWECLLCEEKSISTIHGARNCTSCGKNQIANAERTHCTDMPITMVQWRDPIVVVVILLMMLGIMATLFVVGVFVKFDSTPLVKAANRELSYLLLFCIALYYTAPVIYIWKPDSISCPFYQAWYFLLSITCVAILGVKTHRIVNLFNTAKPNSELRKGFLIRYRHLWGVLAVSATVFIIMLIWVLVDPPRPHLNKSLVTEYVLECKPTSNVVGDICHWLLVTILTALAILCGVYAFKARKLPHIFNEAKFIAFAIYVILIAWLIYYPVFITIRGKYMVILSCFSTLISATSLLSCIFAPKVFIILFYPNKSTQEFVKAELTKHTFGKKKKEQSSNTSASGLSTNPNPNYSTMSGSNSIGLELQSIHLNDGESKSGRYKPHNGH